MMLDYLPLPGTPRDQLDTPCLLIDLPAMQRNIRKMADFLRQRNVACRPHFKTPKCPAICAQQIAAGAVGVCVAKVGEAEVVAAAGIKDILIANQVVGAPKIARLMSLCRMADIIVAVDDPRQRGGTLPSCAGLWGPVEGGRGGQRAHQSVWRRARTAGGRSGQDGSRCPWLAVLRAYGLRRTDSCRRLR